jgi:hypothetical protein
MIKLMTTMVVLFALVLGVRAQDKTISGKITD